MWSPLCKLICIAKRVENNLYKFFCWTNGPSRFAARIWSISKTIVILLINYLETCNTLRFLFWFTNLISLLLFFFLKAEYSIRCYPDLIGGCQKEIDSPTLIVYLTSKIDYILSRCPPSGLCHAQPLGFYPNRDFNHAWDLHIYLKFKGRQGARISNATFWMEEFCPIKI